MWASVYIGAFPGHMTESDKEAGISESEEEIDIFPSEVVLKWAREDWVRQM
jgi:hypothetical protein